MSEKTLSTGVTMAYDEFGPSGGPALVFVHGLSGRRNTWDAVIADLHSRYPQLRMLAVDLRGHGDSSHAEESGYNAIAFAADLAALLKTLDAGPALVLGHSLGGLVAHALAVLYPDDVHSLLLEDPPTFEGDPARRAASPVAAVFPVVISALSKLKERKAPVEDYRELASKFGPPDLAGERMYELQAWDYRTMSAAMHGTVWAGFDVTAPIPAPVTVIRADPARNAVFQEIDVAPFIAAQPHASVVMVERSEHMVHAHETFADFMAHVYPAVDSFLSSTSEDSNS